MKTAGENRKSLVVAVVGFFVVMLMLTILSRAIASFAVVEVRAATPTSRVISEIIEVSAVAQKRLEIAVRTEPGQTVETVYVEVGDMAEQGKPLFKLRMDDLYANITQLEEDRYLVQLRVWILNEQINKVLWATGLSNSELDLQLTSALIDLDRLDQKLARLYSLYDTDGYVYAPVEGLISDVWVRAGDTTSGGTVLMIADNSAGTKLVFSVQSESAQYFGGDVTLTVTNRSTGKLVKGVEIGSIVENSLSSTLMDVTLYLSDESAPIGATLDVRLTISSASYGSCIPLSALHQGPSGAYVFVVDEERSTLGTEQVARMVYVTVAAQDRQWAAAEGLGRNQLVIIEATKMLTDKDRVKVI